MSLRRTAPIVFAAAALATLAACGGGRDDAAERAMNPAPSVPTSPAAPSTGAPSPTSTTAVDTTLSTSATEETTTTTIAADPAGSANGATPPALGAEVASALELRPDGLGRWDFGALADDVVDGVNGLLGAPTVDSGWLDSLDAPYGACPGPRVRVVRWGQLQLYFGDESEVSEQPGHFYHYSYGEFVGEPPAPEGLVTASNIGLGSTLADVRAAAPDAEVYDDPFYGAGFVVTPGGLSGTLSNATDIGRVTVLFGGIGCGE